MASNYTQNIMDTQSEKRYYDPLPFVTVIMPIRNEAGYIDRSLGSVLSQDYPSHLVEIIIVDGASTDGTKEIVRNYQVKHPNITLIDNPKKIVPYSLNLAISQAKGEIFVRVDGHCEIAPDYVRMCVRRLSQSRVDCVGGPMDTIGEFGISQTIALAMSSPFGVGGSPFRTIKDRSMLVDSVAFPAYTRQAIEKTGFFDEELVRNQDDEYNYRLRSLGGRVMLAPEIRSKYYSRSSLRSLLSQYFQYGYWKVRVMQKHPKQMALRQFIPPIFVLMLLVSCLVAAFIPSGWILLAAISLSYVTANLAASLWTALHTSWEHVFILPIVYAILHLGYGAGFLFGLVKFAPYWGKETPRYPLKKQAEKIASLAIPRLEKPVDKLSWVTNFDNFLRRGLDIVVSLTGMILLWPIFLLITILVKRDSPGPGFYRGPRAGMNGKIFNIIKFRTMYEDEASYAGSRVTKSGDERITTFGRWLRDTKLNELPQLWNVLVGDMSLVGPRPEDPQIVEKWPEEVRQEMLSVRPGITSPASILYRNEEQMFRSKNVMDEYLRTIMPGKLRLDMLFTRHRTVVTDLDVIFWTAILLTPRLNQLKVPDRLLFFGPISHFVSRYLTWFLIDNFVAFGAVATAGIIWRIGEPLNLGFNLAVGIAFVIGFLFSLINAIAGVNRITWSRARGSDVLKLAASSGLVTIAIFIANMLLPGERLLPPSMVIITGLFAFFGFVAIRYRNRLVSGLSMGWTNMRGSSMGSLGERVLIVGAGEVAQFALWLLRNGDIAKSFTVVGMVDDDLRKNGMQIDGCPVIGETNDIPMLVDKLDIGLVFYAITNVRREERERILTTCQSIPARLIMMPDILDTMRAYFPSDEKGRDQLFVKVLQNTTIDRLTGIYNSNQLLLLAEKERPRARRYSDPLSVLCIAVDYELPEGEARNQMTANRVLQHVAEKCQSSIRDVDILGRYNSNEFVIVLPETDSQGAIRLAERLQIEMAKFPFQSDYGTIEVSLRIGISEDSENYPDAVSLIESAKNSMKAHQ